MPGYARSIHRGESWKIPLSFLPTQSECVFTQPPGDPAQAGQTDESIPDREGTPGEHSQAEGPLCHPAGGKPLLSSISVV